MTYAAKTGMQRASVFGMNPAEGARKRVAFVGRGDQMDVIWHKTVGRDSHAVVLGVVLEQVEIQLVILGAEVSLLAVVTSLRDMVRNSGKHKAGDSRHER